MRDAALEVLARNDVPARLAARDAFVSDLAGLSAELAAVQQQIPWWERAAFFRDSPDELRAAWLSDRRGAAQLALDEAERALATALDAASAELPAIGIARRCEQIVACALADPSVGLGGAGDERAASELAALADSIASTWVPGLDAADVLAALADDARRDAASSRALGAPREDPRLGWRPIAPDELVARAAAALRNETFAALRAGLHREAAQHAAIAARVRALRKASTTFDVMIGRNLDQHQEALHFESRLPHEHAELVAAFEAFDHAILAALGAFPPMRLALAAQRAAGVLRAGLHAAEPTLDAQGALVLAPSVRFRALFLAGLVDLRAALDAAFPGLGALVGGRGGARDAVDLARAAEALRASRDRGPYRERGPSAEEAPPPPRPADLEAQLAMQLDQLGLGARRERALAHAAMIASLGRWKEKAGERIGLVDRLAFWSDSAAEEEAAALAARERWHRGFAHALVEEAVGLVRAGTQGVFAVALRDAVMTAHAVTGRLGTRRGSSSTSMACPVFHHAEAIAAVGAVAATVGAAWGLRGGRADLVAAVTAHLRARGPVPSPAAAQREARPLAFGDVVVSVAEALRGGPWLAVHDQLTRAAAAHGEASAAVQAAEAGVTTWDRVNVFTDSPAEASRDAWAARADAAAVARRTAQAHLDALLDASLAVYPPGAAYYGLELVQAQIRAVRAVLRRRTHTRRVGNTTTTSTSYHCELVGKSEALHALRRWTLGAIGVFGRLPSDGEILARTWSRALTARAAG